MYYTVHYKDWTLYWDILTIQVLLVSENSVSGDTTTNGMLGVPVTGYTALCNLRLSTFTLATMACW